VAVGGKEIDERAADVAGGNHKTQTIPTPQSGNAPVLPVRAAPCPPEGVIERLPRF
jgi:hypothetical protein